MSMLKRAGTVLACLALGLALSAVAAMYAKGARGICRHEYSRSCVWFGPVQGNHAGRIVVNGSHGSDN
jgi:hypothetical protein